MEKGLIIVISGPAGSGKGTVVGLLRDMMPDIGYSVSATTRTPRPGETDGVHYHFMSKLDFEKKLAENEVLEHTRYCGNYYGTLKSESEKIINAGKDIILEIEVEGASQVKKIYPDAVCIMLLPPSAEALAARLRGRGTETETVIRRRLSRAEKELKYLEFYDYVVINGEGDQDGCAAKILGIIDAEHSKCARMKDFTDNFFS